MKKKYSKNSLNEIYEAAEKITRREPRLEEILATDPFFSFLYAKNILRGRFEQGEATIAGHSSWAYQYCHCVIKGRWPQIEATLAKCPTQVCLYAGNVIRGRFIEGEKTIMQLPCYAVDYAIRHMKSRWLEAEQYIAKSMSNKPDSCGKYLKFFPEAKADWIARGWITS